MTKENKNWSLADAILEFRMNVSSVTLDSDNPFFKSKYASYNNVQETINPALEMLGIIVVQAPNIIDGIDVLNTKVYLASNPSDFIESNIRLLVPKGDMQQLGGAITYARRYALVSIFSLATEDDDGNEASQHPPAPIWDDVMYKNDIIVDAKKLMDKDEMDRVLNMLDDIQNSRGVSEFKYEGLSENKAIRSKQFTSIWSGLGKDYQQKYQAYRRQQRKNAVPKVA
jgi:hypothetical protein